MFRKILLPLDGSKNSEKALPWVKRYATALKAQVVLLRALHTVYPIRGDPFCEGAGEAREYLQGIERELNYAGICTKSLVAGDAVSRTIVEAASKEKCDLIVMASRGASRVVRWLVGGVTEQVLRLSPIPLLIVRSQAEYDDRSHPKRVFVPLDGSPLAASALAWAALLAKFHHARVVLLHVRPPGSDPSRLTAPARQVLKQAASLRKKKVRLGLKFEAGDAAGRIVAACRPADLIVMTTHGYGGLKRWVFGSVAEKVIREAPAAVFVYKSPNRV